MEKCADPATGRPAPPAGGRARQVDCAAGSAEAPAMAFRCKSTLAPLAFGAAMTVLGCGEPPGAETTADSAAGGSAGNSTLETDLMSAERAPGVAAETALPAVAESSASAAPKVIYLVYAD